MANSQNKNIYLEMIHPPDAIVVLVTSRCNASCTYCPFHKDILDFPVDPDIALLKQRFKEAAEYKTKYVRLSGGEPLLRRDLEEMIVYMSKLGLQASMVTNGSLLTTDRMESLTKAGIRAITLSVDTLDQDVYELVRGLPFTHIQRNLDMFEQMHKTGAPVWTGLTVVITRYNIEHLPRMVENLSARYIPIQFQPIHSYSDSEIENASNEPEIGQVEKLVDILISMREQGYLVNNSTRYLQGIVDFSRTKRPPKDFTCPIPWTTAVYDGDMNLRPCCYPHTPISNSCDAPFPVSWNCDEMNVWREKISRMECHGCWLLSLDTWK
jgi:MoaA/NifB/PqqE/SkfB family radical SAM enzyme